MGSEDDLPICDLGIRRICVLQRCLVCITDKYIHIQQSIHNNERNYSSPYDLCTYKYYYTKITEFNLLLNKLTSVIFVNIALH